MEKQYTPRVLADLTIHEQKLDNLEKRVEVLQNTPRFSESATGMNNRAVTNNTRSVTKGAQNRIPTQSVVSPFASKRAFVKWAGPCLVVGFGGYVGSAGLHYASYNFVHQMDAWNNSVVNGNWSSTSDRSLANEIMDDFSSLEDPVETNVFGPPVHIQMSALDMLALAFPAAFTLLAVYTERCELWTKVMICTGLLAACKGIIGALTTVPDSSGWEICRDAHLGPEGYAWLRQDHSFFEIVTVDFWWFPSYFKPLRYCSDMMFSGHTFFVTLYALGLYEVAIIATSKWHLQDKNRGRATCKRACVLALVSLATIGQQAGEIYFVLLSRFHYSSDVFVALLLTFLFYTNGAVCVAAKQWALRDIHFITMGLVVLRASLVDQGSVRRWSKDGSRLHHVSMPHHCCCGPCACVFADLGGDPVENPLHGVSPVDDDTFRRAHRSGKWVSRADILVPWCCLPFCCLSGREHVYSDRGAKLLYDDEELAGGRPPQSHHMHMCEGISSNDARNVLRWWRNRGGASTAT